MPKVFLDCAPSCARPFKHRQAFSPLEAKMEKVLLTTREMARFLRISTSTIDKYRRRGLIPYVMLPNGQVRFGQKEIMKWIEEKRVPRL